MAAYGYNPAPGAQAPGNYQIQVGPNYQKYGEQPGYFYDPYKDHYDTPEQHAIKLAQSKQADEIINPKKPPGLASTIAPLAATGLVLAGAKPVGEYLAGGLPGVIKDAKGLFGLGAPQVAAVAPQAATPAAAAIAGAPAAPELLSATATGAAPAASGGLFSLGGIGSAGNAILPAVGAFGAYDVFSHGSQYSPTRAGLQGAASGAAIGSTFAPVLGTAIGAGVGGLLGLASSMTGGHDHGRVEYDRRQKAAENGAYIPPEILNRPALGARSRDELVEIAKQTGTPQDIKFAKSRNINDLKGSGQSITGFTAFAEQIPDWFKRTQEERNAYANQLLEQGVVNEHNGTLDIDWKKAVPPPWEAAKPAAPVAAVNVPAANAPAIQPRPATIPAPDVRGLLGLGSEVADPLRARR